MPLTRASASGVRRILQAADLPEFRGEAEHGFLVSPSQKKPGVIYVQAVLDRDKFKFQSSLRWANNLLADCRVELEKHGYAVERGPGIRPVIKVTLP